MTERYARASPFKNTGCICCRHSNFDSRPKELLCVGVLSEVLTSQLISVTLKTPQVKRQTCPRSGYSPLMICSARTRLAR